jgi:hypothetical protein
MLAGPEHGRTIPSADIGEAGMLLCGRDPQNVSSLGADDVIE